MKNSDADPRIVEYLRRLRWALEPLPESDREDIVLEVADHLMHRAHESNGLTDAMAALGAPQDYARNFVEDFELHTQLNLASPKFLLLTVLSRATRSVTAAFFGTTGLLFYSLAISSALIAIAKFIAPGSVGWWWASENAFAIGIAWPSPTQVPELLGYWIVPIFIMISVLTYSLGRLLLRTGARRLLKREARQNTSATPAMNQAVQ